MEVHTAREWLAIADFDNLSGDLHQALVERVGFDKAHEVEGALRRITENLLDTLGPLRLSEDSLMLLMRAVSSIAIDSYAPDARR